jgi:photosystem II stability/assembly factor-like uncharacterized protein
MENPKSDELLSSDAAPPGSWRDSVGIKRGTLVLSLVLLLLSGYLSWRQPTPGQNDPQTSFLQHPVRGFFYPIEVNPQFRPPTYPSNWFSYPWAVKSEKRPQTRLTGLEDIVVVPGSTAGTLVAVGRDGTILRTTDGGASWDPQRSGTPKTLFGVTFADAQAGWAVGQDGKILHSPDGGVSWNSQREAPGEDLYSVTFSDARTGWTVGPRRVILRTTDGGANWSADRRGTADYSPSGVAFTDALNGWIVGSPGTILHSANGGISWGPQPSDTPNILYSVTFTDAQLGWAVGREGTIVHTTDGGEIWNTQRSGTPNSLYGAAFADARTGWVVGSRGLILHTTDGGASWTPQEAFRYRHYPAPWFYASLVLLLPIFYWALLPVLVTEITIQPIVAPDAPVASLQGDRLGQRLLVERLSGLLMNRNTLPPLVMALQAPWGMGKTSVMRMMQSNLEEKYRAVTVWFNAWHHQKEDQLLAYLMETIQKEAVPQWLSLRGPFFRLKLISERLLGWRRLDRLALLAAGAALFYISVFQRSWLPGVLVQNQWLTNSVPFIALLPLLNVLIAFKSNPEKLTHKSGGVLVDTFKELIRLPSLVGKSDVRQEFANNLKDVVAALRPHRLVIFFDDLDRCKPDQVIQVLEALNFLSSVANCFLIVGADYKKVETLVANEFENIAIREKENETKGRVELDALEYRVDHRMKYARNYLKKIVNLRIDLAAPRSYTRLLTNEAEEETEAKKTEPETKKEEPETMPFWKFGTVGTIRAVTATKPRLIACSVAAAVLLGAGVWWGATWGIERWHRAKEQTIQSAAGTLNTGTAAKVGSVLAPGPNAGTSDNPSLPNPNLPGPSTASPSVPSPETPEPSAASARQDGELLRDVIVFGLPLLIAAIVAMSWFNRQPTTEESKDAETFTAALKRHSGKIFDRCESPREARRFLNYLRLIGNNKDLRNKYGERFDQDLVGMAVTRELDNPELIDSVKEYYVEQCNFFGLDPKTFEPHEHRDEERVGSAELIVLQ